MIATGVRGGSGGRLTRRLNFVVVERLKRRPMAAKAHIARGMRWWRVLLDCR